MVTAPLSRGLFIGFIIEIWKEVGLWIRWSSKSNNTNYVVTRPPALCLSSSACTCFWWLFLWLWLVKLFPQPGRLQRYKRTVCLLRVSSGCAPSIQISKRSFLYNLLLSKGKVYFWSESSGGWFSLLRRKTTFRIARTHRPTGRTLGAFFVIQERLLLHVDLWATFVRTMEGTNVQIV